MAMASVAHQLSAVRWSPMLWRRSQKQRRGAVPIVCSVAISNAQNKERVKLKQLFEDAYERCRTAPTEGVSFTLEQSTALEKYDFDAEIGTKACSLLFIHRKVFNLIAIPGCFHGFRFWVVVIFCLFLDFVKISDFSKLKLKRVVVKLVFFSLEWVKGFDCCFCCVYVWMRMLT